jgi:hypothetical protein
VSLRIVVCYQVDGGSAVAATVLVWGLVGFRGGMQMQGWARRYGLGVASPQYDPGFHLSRPVKCVECGTLFQKTHLTRYDGYRCLSCSQQWGNAQTPMASHEVAEVAL